MDLATFKEMNKDEGFVCHLNWFHWSVESQIRHSIEGAEIRRNGGDKENWYGRETEGQRKRAKWLYEKLIDDYEQKCKEVEKWKQIALKYRRNCNV